MNLSKLPGDEITGQLVWTGGERVALVCGAAFGPLPGEVITGGGLMLRYGLPFLYKRDHFLIEWVYDDFRREHSGEAALDFIRRQGERFPRADVGGWLVSTGKPKELFLKQLDIGAGLQVLAYRGQNVDALLARIDAAVWLDAAVEGWGVLPPDDERAPVLLRRAVPCWLVNQEALAALPDHLEDVAHA